MASVTASMSTKTGGHDQDVEHPRTEAHDPDRPRDAGPQTPVAPSWAPFHGGGPHMPHVRNGRTRPGRAAEPDGRSR